MTVEISIIGPSANARSRNVQADRRVNLYAEQAENKTLSLYPRQGIELFTTVGAGPIRGQIVSGDYRWVVSGSSLYRVSSTGTATLIGGIVGTGPVAIAENGIQVMIGCGASIGYVVTVATSVLAQITDVDFVGADWIAYLDGYFIFGLSGSFQFYKTALYDGMDIDSLDFASAEGNPDAILTGIVDHRELLLFGSRATEGWRNTGAAGFPLERIEGAFMEHGCASARSVCKIDNSVFFVGQDDKGWGMVLRIEGYSPTIISTRSIEDAISQWTDLSDSYAWSFQDKGHTYYVLSSESGNETWVYDCATQQWTQWATRDPVTTHQNRFRGCNHTFANGVHVVGDHSNGNLYRLASDVKTDNGDPISQIFQFQLPRDGNKRMFLSRMELICETGIGLTTGQGSDPQAMLEISKDGGHTWGNSRWRSMGAVGRFEHRTFWDRLGCGRQLVGRIAVTDPVATAWIGIEVDIESGES